MLRNLLISITMFCPGLLALGQNCLSLVSYTPEDSIKVCTILRKDSAHHVSYCGRQLLGTPYVAHTLEINDPECLVVNLRELDCTTFMETSMTLALTALKLKTESQPEKADTFALYCHTLQKIRYRKGEISEYPSRLHYICDWSADNVAMEIIEDITGTHAEDFLPVRIGYMSANPEKYKQLKEHPEYVSPIRTMEERCNAMCFAYLPKSKLPAEGKKWIHEGDLIAMLTTIEGLDVSHVGIAVYVKDELHLMHASMIEKQVIIDPRPLSQQINKKSCPGIRVFRIQG